jgi:hypothetical protein
MHINQQHKELDYKPIRIAQPKFETELDMHLGRHCLTQPFYALGLTVVALMAGCGGAEDNPPTAPTTTSASAQDAAPSLQSGKSIALGASPTLTENAAPAGYTACANEGQRCAFEGTANVVYGAANSWTAPRSFTGAVDCGNAIFGDPLYGVVKTCFVAAVPGSQPPGPGPNPTDDRPPAGYAKCAAERERCNVTGAADVIYGARDTWTSAARFSGGVDCGNATFGDPLYGVVKSCYARPAAPITPGPGAISQALFTGTTADFPNPERGFYGWSGGDFVTAYDAASVKATSDAGLRLLLAPVLLDSFRNADLTADWLNALNASFAKVRAAGMKVTLVVTYDFSAGGKDATAAQIKRHLEQLRPVLAANADVVPYMRAGFIGAWGEWHSSQSGNSCGYNSLASVSCEEADANRIIVRDALFANVPSTTQIGFRDPADLQKWYPSPTQQTRAGMHNDCFLSGPTDTGTYIGAGSRPYARALSENTAFGGETCDDAGKPARDTCADILSEGAQYHVAWLNINYGPSFIKAWRAGGCFSEVSRSLGYRLQLDAIAHASAVVAGESVAFQVDLRNVGWARVFSNRNLVVTLKHKTTGTRVSGAAGNLRELASQANASTRLSVNVAVPASAPAGDYEVHLSAPDVFASLANDPRFAVRFANDDKPPQSQAWDSGLGAFKTGTVVTVR